MIRVSPSRWTDAFRCSLFAIGTAAVLAVCLLSERIGTGSNRAGWALPAEVAAVLRDPSTQWMVFICLGTYVVAFALVLGVRRVGLSLLGLLAFAALDYGAAYSRAAVTTDALVLVGGAALGLAAAVCERNRSAPAPGRSSVETNQRPEYSTGARSAGVAAPGDGRAPSAKFEAECCHTLGPSPRQVRVCDFPTLVTSILTVFLAAAVLWQGAWPRDFHYLGEARWSGVWANPNTFGNLEGVGCLLALGQLVAAVARRAGLSRGSRWRRRGSLALWTLLLGLTGLGLLHSFSRGAWLGALVGLLYLAAAGLRPGGSLENPTTPARPRSRPPSGWFRSRFRLKLREAGAEQGGPNPTRTLIPLPVRWPASLRRNLLPVALALLAVAVLAYWSVPRSGSVVARRALSVANQDDFSWRNRTAAWVGSLQMMAERPWLGFGWNATDRAYDQYYRPAKVNESAAIQLNDFLSLGAALGIPALVCFALCLARSLSSTFARFNRFEFVSDFGSRPSDFPPGRTHRVPAEPASWPTPWLRAVCAAGAVSLLVGFWFDGGLFRLAAAGTFWILLELGAEIS